MNYLSVESISKSFGDIQLFENITFGIEKGQKIALIAKNGTGKSTLFNLLSGKDSPDNGSIVFNNDASIGFLEQDPVFESEMNVLEAVFDSKNPSIEIIKNYEKAMTGQSDQNVLQHCIDQMDHFNLWDFEQKIKEILSLFKIEDFDKKINELSGGQLKRLAIAKVIIESPDFILLDEPTNHLDIEMIEWLEAYLSKQNITIFMVTHDRYFLESICNEIFEIDDKQLYRYKGNYSYYLEQKSSRQENQKAEIEKAKNLLRTELDWMRRMPQARGTKSKDRIDRFYQLQDVANSGTYQKDLKLDVIGKRMGNKILELDNISKNYGEVKILDHFSYKFQKFEKLGIIGPNGSGKSSFINILSKTIEPDSGEISIGETIEFGYYKQENIKVDENKRLIEVVKDIAEFIPINSGKFLTASQMLERFLFPTQMHYVQVSKLSGGEKRRLFLLTVLMKNPNFLILDEPTNDLDILTLNVLEEFLLSFGGCLIIISHDRYFLDKLVDHIFIFKGNGVIKDFNGKYTDYKELLKWEEKQRNKKATISKSTGKQKEKDKGEKRKLSYKEKLELQSLESELGELEGRKAELENLIASGLNDHEVLNSYAIEISSLMAEIEAKENRWLELSELM